MTRALLAALILILIAATTATAPTVDSAWHRSDEAPEPTPTTPPPEEMPAPTAAPPENATAPEEPEAASKIRQVVGILLCSAMIVIAFWYCKREAKR